MLLSCGLAVGRARRGAIPSPLGVRPRELLTPRSCTSSAPVLATTASLMLAGSYTAAPAMTSMARLTATISYAVPMAAINTPMRTGSLVAAPALTSMAMSTATMSYAVPLVATAPPMRTRSCVAALAIASLAMPTATMPYAVPRLRPRSCRSCCADGRRPLRRAQAGPPSPSASRTSWPTMCSRWMHLPS